MLKCGSGQVISVSKDLDRLLLMKGRLYPRKKTCMAKASKHKQTHKRNTTRRSQPILFAENEYNLRPLRNLTQLKHGDPLKALHGNEEMMKAR